MSPQGHLAPRLQQTSKRQQYSYGWKNTKKECPQQTQACLLPGPYLLCMREGHWKSEYLRLEGNLVPPNQWWLKHPVMIMSEASYCPTNYVAIMPMEPQITVDVVGKPITFLLDMVAAHSISLSRASLFQNSFDHWGKWHPQCPNKYPVGPIPGVPTYCRSPDPVILKKTGHIGSWDPTN